MKKKTKKKINQHSRTLPRSIQLGGVELVKNLTIMKNYKAILFHPEGDYVTDFRNNSEIQPVWEAIADMGSRWIFYPIPFVGTDKTISDAPEGLEFLIGKRIKTAQKFFENQWKKRADEICNLMNNGLPFSLIY